MAELTPAQAIIWRKAKAKGYDDEGAAVAVAIASSEGLGSKEPGDNGHSIGNWQLYFGGGAGDTWASVIGKPIHEAKAILTADPYAADDWWLGEVLKPAVTAAQKMGVHGPDLARYAGMVTEKPLEGNERRYGTTYAQLFGAGVPGTILDAEAVPGPADWLPKGVDLPAPLRDRWYLTGDKPPEIAAETTVPRAITAQAKATQQVAEAISPLTAIATFFTGLFNPGSETWRGLEILLMKIIASIILLILMVMGIRAAILGEAMHQLREATA